MSLTKEQLKREKDYLAKVTKVFDKKFDEELNSFNNIDEQVKSLRHHINQNKGSLDPYEISQIRQTIERLTLSGDLVNKKYALLNKVKGSPYFARIDFDDYNYKELLNIYIGLTSIYEEGHDKYLVYDWRSPIASLYYKEGTGEVSYTAPAGIIYGNINLKRQYKIEDRNLQFVFDNSLNIDDELLKEALNKNTSAKMKNIVNSIQKEQNQVIRNEHDEVLIIDGPAGSGKTSVALHRIAFLLYRERDTIKAENIVILSPNKVFSEYISSVLPELGEDNVEYLTFSEYYLDSVQNYRNAQSFNNYIKTLYESNNTLKQDSLKLKASKQFKKILDDYLKEYENNIVFKDLVFKNKVAMTKEEFKLLYTKKYKKFKLATRMENILETATLNLHEGLSIFDRTQVKKGTVKKVLRSQIKTKFNNEKIYKDLYLKPKFIEERTKGLKFSNDINKICKFILSEFKNEGFNYDDLIGVTYVKLFIEGLRQEEDVKHLIIDEAQDYSLLQYEIIKNTFNKAKFTILGDVNQAIIPHLKYKNFNLVEKLFNNKRTKPFSLINCYRNSFEIAEFSNSLLSLKDIRAMNRYEGKPTVKYNLDKHQILNNIKQKVNEYKSQGFKQIGVITKTTDEAKEVYENLKDQIEDLHYIDFEKDNFEDGVVVLGSYVSKGLEFDCVLSVHFKNAYSNKEEKNLLYVVFTRALHKLDVLIEGSSLGIVKNIQEDKYNVE